MSLRGYVTKDVTVVTHLTPVTSRAGWTLTAGRRIQDVKSIILQCQQGRIMSHWQMTNN